MALEQYEKAEEALDKYIQLKPDDPNPYDSKGDYYMAVEIDSTRTGSLRKARRARALIKSDKEE